MEETTEFSDTTFNSNILKTEDLISEFNFDFIKEKYNIELENDTYKKQFNINKIKTKYEEILNSNSEEVKDLKAVINLHITAPYLGIENLFEDNKEINMDLISCYKNLEPDFINAIGNKLNWNCVLKYTESIPENLIEKYINKILPQSKDELSRKKDLSLEFILKHFNDLNVDLILENNINLIPEFFTKSPNSYLMSRIGEFYVMTPEYYSKYESQINWGKLRTYKNVELNLLEKHMPELNFNTLMNDTQLTTNILILYKNKINWEDYLKKYPISSLILSQCYTQIPVEILLKAVNFNIENLISFLPNINLKDISVKYSHLLNNLTLDKYLNLTSNLYNIQYLHLTVEELNYLIDNNLTNYLTLNNLNYVKDFKAFKILVTILSSQTNETYKPKKVITTEEYNCLAESNIKISAKYILDDFNNHAIELQRIYDKTVEKTINQIAIQYTNLGQRHQEIFNLFKTEGLMNLNIIIENYKDIEISFKDFLTITELYQDSYSSLLLLNICKLDFSTIMCIFNFLRTKHIKKEYLENIFKALRNNKNLSPETREILFNNNYDIFNNLEILFYMANNYVNAFK